MILTRVLAVTTVALDETGLNGLLAGKASYLLRVRLVVEFEDELRPVHGTRFVALCKRLFQRRQQL